MNVDNKTSANYNNHPHIGGSREENIQKIKNICNSDDILRKLPQILKNPAIQDRYIQKLADQIDNGFNCQRLLKNITSNPPINESIDLGNLNDEQPSKFIEDIVSVENEDFFGIDVIYKEKKVNLTKFLTESNNYEIYIPSTQKTKIVEFGQIKYPLNKVEIIEVDIDLGDLNDEKPSSLSELELPEELKEAKIEEVGVDLGDLNNEQPSSLSGEELSGEKLSEELSGEKLSGEELSGLEFKEAKIEEVGVDLGDLNNEKPSELIYESNFELSNDNLTTLYPSEYGELSDEQKALAKLLSIIDTSKLGKNFLDNLIYALLYIPEHYKEMIDIQTGKKSVPSLSSEGQEIIVKKKLINSLQSKNDIGTETEKRKKYEELIKRLQNEIKEIEESTFSYANFATKDYYKTLLLTNEVYNKIQSFEEWRIASIMFGYETSLVDIIKNIVKTTSSKLPKKSLASKSAIYEKSPTSEKSAASKKSPTSEKSAVSSSKSATYKKSPTSEKSAASKKSPTSEKSAVSSSKSPTSEEFLGVKKGFLNSPSPKSEKSPTSEKSAASKKSPTSEKSAASKKSPTSEKSAASKKSPTSSSKSPTSEDFPGFKKGFLSSPSSASSK
jgi:hypothetical protein